MRRVSKTASVGVGKGVISTASLASTDKVLPGRTFEAVVVPDIRRLYSLALSILRDEGVLPGGGEGGGRPGEAELEAVDAAAEPDQLLAELGGGDHLGGRPRVRLDGLEHVLQRCGPAFAITHRSSIPNICSYPWRSHPPLHTFQPARQMPGTHGGPAGGLR